MSKDYVYSDAHKTLKINPSGNVDIKYDEAAIIQSIEMIFATVSGERVRSPIGSALIRLLFQPISDDTARDIHTMIHRDITQFEPRVEIRQLRVTPNYDRNYYDVQVQLRIKKIKRPLLFETRLRSLT